MYLVYVFQCDYIILLVVELVCGCEIMRFHASFFSIISAWSPVAKMCMAVCMYKVCMSACIYKMCISVCVCVCVCVCV